MKKLILIAFVFIVSCKEDNLQFIGQEIIDGRISSIEPGYVIYVQTNKTTKTFSIPPQYENRWKIGDNCLLIIQKYKEVKTK